MNGTRTVYLKVVHAIQIFPLVNKTTKKVMCNVSSEWSLNFAWDTNPRYTKSQRIIYESDSLIWLELIWLAVEKQLNYWIECLSNSHLPLNPWPFNIVSRVWSWMSVTGIFGPKRLHQGANFVFKKLHTGDPLHSEGFALWWKLNMTAISTKTIMRYVECKIGWIHP